MVSNSSHLSILSQNFMNFNNKLKIKQVSIKTRLNCVN